MCSCTLGQLARHESYRRASLAGLSRDDVALLIEALRVAPPSAEMVDAIARRTDGNPFFIRELIEQAPDAARGVGRNDGGKEVAMGVLDVSPFLFFVVLFCFS